MPRLRYKPRIHIPLAVLEIRTLSPTRIRQWVLNRFNKAVTPESVTMWFRRHSKVKEELQNKLLDLEIPQEEISPTIFNNGAFEKLESVDQWIRDMRRRQLRKRTLSDWVGTLKRICQGVFPYNKIDLQKHGWSLKHPDRLRLDDCIHFIDLILEHHAGQDIAKHTRVMRSFLQSKGVIADRIPAPESIGAGKMSDLFVERDVLEKMLQWIKRQNYEAYLVDLFMFKTAARITATLNALVEDIKAENGYKSIRIYDKGNGRKYPQGRPLDKYLPPDLFKEICELTGYPERKRGKIFPNLTEVDTGSLNKEALEKYAPWVFKKYPNIFPNHFWRHMFAQHMLRATEWNYCATAALGGWSVSALERNYGKPPKAQVKAWGLQHVPSL